MGVSDVVRVEHIGNLFYVGAALLLSIRDAVGTLYTTGKEELKLCKFEPRFSNFRFRYHLTIILQRN